MPRLEDAHRLAQTGHVRPRKYPSLQPRVGPSGAIAADEMKQTAAGRLQAAVNDAAELAVMSQADVLQHADGYKHVVAAGDVAVIVFHELYAALQPLDAGALLGVGDLRVRDVERLDGDAVVPGHVQGQRSPAAARLH